MYINRNDYLEKLINSINNGMIKVIVGARRCGKSFLLFNIFKDYLLKNGYREDQIIELKLDDLSNLQYRNLHNFQNYFIDRMIDKNKSYILLIDEIQYVSKMENPYVKGQIITFYDVLNSFLNMKNVEVFVTGSNSHMLSTDVKTEFRGRSWNIRMKPLSFYEYVQNFKNQDINTSWNTYKLYGGMPLSLAFNNDNDKQNYLSDLFENTYIKDIIERYSLKNETNVKEVLKVIASNIGSLNSFTNIANTYESVEKTSISVNTIKQYVGFFEQAFLLKKVSRYDVKGKKIIGAPYKFYFEDIGIRNAILDFLNVDDDSHIMENIIFNALVGCGYNVSVGNIISNELNDNNTYSKKQLEIDFYYTFGGEKFYIQSVYDIHGEEKLNQEKKSLLKIQDGFKKVIISKSVSINHYDNDGILYINLFDFLLNPRMLEDDKLLKSFY